MADISTVMKELRENDLAEMDKGIKLSDFGGTFLGRAATYMQLSKQVDDSELKEEFNNEAKACVHYDHQLNNAAVKKMTQASGVILEEYNEKVKKDSKGNSSNDKRT